MGRYSMSDERTFPDREELGADGSTRKQHYGHGEQPWDVIVRIGWGPEVAASCIIRYLRRTKDLEHSLESARWYHARLTEMTRAEHSAQCWLRARQVMGRQPTRRKP